MTARDGGNAENEGSGFLPEITELKDFYVLKA
jgi:hypothetical protein